MLLVNNTPESKIYQRSHWERENLRNRRSPIHPVVSAYVLPKIMEIARYVDITPETLLLDVGCGNGFFTFYFDKLCHVYGVDYSERMLTMNPVRKKFLMDANNLYFQDNSFDIVFCHALLHHVNDIQRVIREMKRVSKKFVIILEPNRNNPLMFFFSVLAKEERNVSRFSLKYLRNMARRNDLHILAAFSYGMIAPNRTPKFLLPLLNCFNFKFPLGLTNFLITMKL